MVLENIVDFVAIEEDNHLYGGGYRIPIEFDSLEEYNHFYHWANFYGLLHSDYPLSIFRRQFDSETKEMKKNPHVIAYLKRISKRANLNGVTIKKHF